MIHPHIPCHISMLRLDHAPGILIALMTARPRKIERYLLSKPAGLPLRVAFFLGRFDYLAGPLTNPKTPIFVPIRVWFQKPYFALPQNELFTAKAQRAQRIQYLYTTL